MGIKKESKTKMFAEVWAPFDSPTSQSEVKKATARGTPHKLTSRNRMPAVDRSEYLNLCRLNRRLLEKIEFLEKELAVYKEQEANIQKVQDIKENYYKNMVQSSELGNFLNCTRQNINLMRRNNQLISVTGKNGNYFPKWQIDQKAQKPYKIIPQVIESIGKNNQWSIIQFFHTTFYSLNNLTPIDCLEKSGVHDELIILEASRFNEQTL